jgi:hypothetical protein
MLVAKGQKIIRMTRFSKRMRSFSVVVGSKLVVTPKFSLKEAEDHTVFCNTYVLANSNLIMQQPKLTVIGEGNGSNALQQKLHAQCFERKSTTSQPQPIEKVRINAGMHARFFYKTTPKYFLQATDA